MKENNKLGGRARRQWSVSVRWVTDACCLLCLCFTGSCCHHGVNALLQPSPIPDPSSWFPVGGELPCNNISTPSCLALFTCVVDKDRSQQPELLILFFLFLFF